MYARAERSSGPDAPTVKTGSGPPRSRGGSAQMSAPWIHMDAIFRFAVTAHRLALTWRDAARLEPPCRRRDGPRAKNS